MTKKPIPKDIKFPVNVVPAARIEEWQGEVKQAEDLAKQIENANKELTARQGVCKFLAKKLCKDFDIGPNDKLDLETGKITRAGKA